MQVVVEQVAIDHHAEVTAIVDAIERVGALAGQEENGLRIDIDQFKHGGGERVLKTEAVLELSESDIEGIVA